MYPITELQRAKNYPFSKTAKRVLKDSDFPLGQTPEAIIERAKKMCGAAFSDEGYSPEIHSSAELLRNEVLAFPVAKILVSLIGRFELYRKFSNMVADSVFASALREKDEVLFDLASELSLNFGIPDSQEYFAELGLRDYLRADFEPPELKLVNQKLKGGKVFLRRNEFARLISIIAGHEVRNSLPMEVKGIPQKFSDAAKAVEQEFASFVRKKFSKADFGAVQPESFPPCMSKIYSELLAGVKVGHAGRFAFATFLHSIGMGTDRIVGMYRATPNFNEKVSRYQVERIAGKGAKGYSAPGCDKMRSYNLCVANCPGTYHPVQFYGREVFRGDAAKKIAVPTEENETA